MLMAIRITDPDTDPNPYRDTRQTCVGGGMQCPSASGLFIWFKLYSFKGQGQGHRSKFVVKGRKVLLKWSLRPRVRAFSSFVKFRAKHFRWYRRFILVDLKKTLVWSISYTYIVLPTVFIAQMLCLYLRAVASADVLPPPHLLEHVY